MGIQYSAPLHTRACPRMLARALLQQRLPLHSTCTFHDLLRYARQHSAESAEQCAHAVVKHNDAIRCVCACTIIVYSAGWHIPDILHMHTLLRITFNTPRGPVMPSYAHTATSQCMRMHTMAECTRYEITILAYSTAHCRECIPVPACTSMLAPSMPMLPACVPHMSGSTVSSTCDTRQQHAHTVSTHT